jgi:hypothetical protein
MTDIPSADKKLDEDVSKSSAANISIPSAADELFKLIDDCTDTYTRTDKKFANGVWHKYGIVDREKLLAAINRLYVPRRDMEALLTEAVPISHTEDAVPVEVIRERLGL